MRRSLEVHRDLGDHACSVVGMAELPFGMPVEIEAEVELRSGEDFAAG